MGHSNMKRRVYTFKLDPIRVEKWRERAAQAKAKGVLFKSIPQAIEDKIDADLADPSFNANAGPQSNDLSPGATKSLPAPKNPSKGS